MQRGDRSFLETLVRSAKERVEDGYYEIGDRRRGARRSLVDALRKPGRVAVIGEVKFMSPSEGRISPEKDVVEISTAFERGGAAAISVLTEPGYFGGSIASLSTVADAVSIPVLMKDVVVDKMQVEAGARAGADAVLLVTAIFLSGLVQSSLDEIAECARGRGLEVVAEAHDETELDAAARSQADVIGINNRDLKTLAVSLETSRRLLLRGALPKPVICESGISRREEVEQLLGLGADGFLVGTALMRAPDPESTLKELSRVGARQG